MPNVFVDHATTLNGWLCKIRERYPEKFELGRAPRDWRFNEYIGIAVLRRAIVNTDLHMVIEDVELLEGARVLLARERPDLANDRSPDAVLCVVPLQ